MLIYLVLKNRFNFGKTILEAMAKRIKKVDSKEVGLEIGLYIFKFFLKTEYLHYGYFKDGLAADVSNLKKAQENYAEMLFENIPEGTKTILDVGCGSGKTAQELIKKGYQVECVSPSILLNKYAETLVGEKGKIHNSKFENFKTDKKYDLVMFSESFQYINMNDSIPLALNYLSENGKILICDFFRTDMPERGPLGGGHKYKEWLEILEKYPVTIEKEKDITNETAPTIDIVDQMAKEVLMPTWKLVFMLAEDRFPLLMKFVKWKYKAKLDKMENKHFSGERNGVNFKKYKIYKMYLLNKK